MCLDLYDNSIYWRWTQPRQFLIGLDGRTTVSTIAIDVKVSETTSPPKIERTRYARDIAITSPSGTVSLDAVKSTFIHPKQTTLESRMDDFITSSNQATSMQSYSTPAKQGRRIMWLQEPVAKIVCYKSKWSTWRRHFWRSWNLWCTLLTRNNLQSTWPIHCSITMISLMQWCWY